MNVTTSTQRPTASKTPAAQNRPVTPRPPTVRDTYAARVAKSEFLYGEIDKHYDVLAGAANDTLQAYFGREDVAAILASPAQFSAEVVALAKKLVTRPELIDLADWTSHFSGWHTHDGTNDRLQYQGARALLANRRAAVKVVDHLLERTASEGGALTREQVLTEQRRLAAGTVAQQKLAAELGKAYYGHDGAWGGLLTIAANASGSESSDRQVLTNEGLQKLRSLLHGNGLTTLKA